MNCPPKQPLQPLPTGLRVLATLSISLITAMTILDTTIANVALPTIAGNLGVASSQSTWVITFYGVANAIAIPLTGWLAKRFGEVRVFLIASMGFVLASFLCGMAYSLQSLILARVLQGMAAGPLIPLSQSLLVACYPREKRGLALAMWSMTVVVGPILGPVLGGYICDSYAWQWIFLVNVPVGAMALLLLRAPMQGRESQVQHSPVDRVGIALLILGVGSLQVMLDEGKDQDWFASPMILALGIVAAISLIVLVIWEITEKHPVIDLSLFRHRNFTVGTVCLCLGFMLYFSSVVLLPMMLQTRMGYTSLWAGLSLAPIGFFSLVVAPLVGKNAQKLDMRALASVSFIIFSLCFFWRANFAPNMDFAYVVWPQFVQGLGVALFFMPLTNISISGMPQHNIAAASSLNNCLRTLAGSVGSSVTMTLWERQEALHHVRLGESLTASNPVLANAMNTLQTMGMTDLQAKAWLNQEVTRQGFLMGCNELFWGGGLLFLLLAGMVWLAQPARKNT